MEVTIFTANNCPNCVQMKTILNHLIGQNYEAKNVDEDEASFSYITGAGFRGVPVVEINGTLYGPNQIRDIEKTLYALARA